MIFTELLGMFMFMNRNHLATPKMSLVFDDFNSLPEIRNIPLRWTISKTDLPELSSGTRTVSETYSIFDIYEPDITPPKNSEFPCVDFRLTFENTIAIEHVLLQDAKKIKIELLCGIEQSDDDIPFMAIKIVSVNKRANDIVIKVYSRNNIFVATSAIRDDQSKLMYKTQLLQMYVKDIAQLFNSPLFPLREQLIHIQ